MKGKLRKELRAKRRSLSAAEHALRSNLAASSITRLAAFKAGARLALYLPFDREVNTAALLVAARRRRVRDFRSGGQRSAASPPALLPVDGQDAARGVRDFGTSPQRPSDRAAMVRSDRRAAGRRRCRGSALGNGRRILRSSSRLPAPPAALDGSAFGRTRLRVPTGGHGVRRSLGRAPGFAGDRIGSAAFSREAPPNEPLASEVGTRPPSASIASRLAPSKRPHGTGCAITRRATCCGTR